jgi:ceramide glucosyltransferase
MSLFLHVLFAVAMLGTVTSFIYCCMVLTAVGLFAMRKRSDERIPPDFTPPLSVLKPVHGTEPGIERNFESFFEQQYAGEWELLFCARQESDEALQLARRVGDRYPQVNARYITCGEPIPKFHNAKVYSLEKLDSVAQHALYVTSDADVRVAPDYLLRMAQNLRDPNLGIASCIYLGTAYGGDDASFVAKLDAVGKSVEMTSGVLVAVMLEGTRFALGATMALPRQSFQEVGGFAALGQFYADDFELGNRLARQGKGVKMATHVIKLMVQDTPFALSFRNASLGPPWHRAHVRHAVRLDGACLGSACGSSRRWSAMARRHSGQSLAAGGCDSGRDGRSGLDPRRAHLSLARPAGKHPVAGKLRRKRVLLSGHNL